MYTMNFYNAKNILKSNILRSFLVYISEYSALIIFALSVFSVCFLFVADTSFLSEIGVFNNEIILSIAVLIAIAEIFALYFTLFYSKLKKVKYYSGAIGEITFFQTFRYSILRLVLSVKKLFDLFVFLSPFMLNISVLLLLAEENYQQEIIYLLISSSTLFFFSGLLFYRMYILKYSLVDFVFINNPEKSFMTVFRISENLTDGKIIRLFILKIFNFPRRLVSVFIFPSVYYLPFCIFSEYDFLLQKENPYSSEMNTDKSVVFFMNRRGEV